MSIYVTDESEVSRARVECDILWRTTTRQAARFGSLGWERGVGGGILVRRDRGFCTYSRGLEQLGSWVLCLVWSSSGPRMIGGKDERSGLTECGSLLTMHRQFVSSVCSCSPFMKTAGLK